MNKKKVVLITKIAVGIFLACMAIFMVVSAGEEEIMVNHGIGITFFALILVSGIISALLLLTEAVLQVIVMYKQHGFKAIAVVMVELVVMMLVFLLIDNFVFEEKQGILRYVIMSVVIVSVSQATVWWKNNK